LVRTPPAERDMQAMQQAADAAAVQWRIVDQQLARREFMQGDRFSLADIAIGTYARRWFGVEGITRPALPQLERWFGLISERPAFQEIVAPPMS
jgi:glutathione S-transferase